MTNKNRGNSRRPTPAAAAGVTEMADITPVARPASDSDPAEAHSGIDIAFRLQRTG